MPRYFMRDTPLQAMEQLMMSQPGQKPRGGGIYRSPFHYTPKDVACKYCQNYDRKHSCRLYECTCLEERIEAGVLELNEFVRDCFALSMGLQLRKRMHQQFRERKPQFFLSDAHRRRWTHWRERCWRLSDRNKATLFLLTAYESLWRRMVWKCGNDGFDFQSVRLGGIEPELYSVWASHRKERPAMKDNAPRVIKIPAKPEATRQAEARRQLRVAAYCRVSTKEEDQANSYEVQKEYYTDKIMSNTAWTMAGIFADKGITGTSAKKREDFMRMIRHCRQKKIDVILTKSVSRFSRNTVDCLYYIRALKQLGIAVIFEKENINSLEEDSELRITLSGAFAQSESESISANVTWGKRRAMEAGKVSIQYKKLYGYRKGEDGQPEIIPEQAEIVRWLYERYLTGASLRMIKDELEQQGVKCFEDSPEWTISRIRSILQNEKYCGDVLMQKTFRQDFINRKAIKNTGQLPMYLIENHHEGIVSREKYDAVQAEMARRNAAKSPSKNAVTGMASYASKYALSERLVCGECGTLYRRCTWTRNGEKRVVWRCVSRLDYGKKYCHNSPTLDEAPLQQAILAVLNTAMADKNSLIRQITDAMETEIIPFPGGTMSLGDIERRLRELEQQFQTLLEKATDDPAAYGGQFKEILDEQTFLKEKRAGILADNSEQAKANQRILDAAQTLENASPHITEWDESAVRQLVETVKVLSKDEIAVTMKGGIEIRQKIMY